MLSLLVLSAASLVAQSGLEFDDVKSAELHRQKTLQNLHVAQAPLHTKQEKATEVEISKYQEAVVQVVAFQQWIAYDGDRSLWLGRTGNDSNDTLNTKKFNKIIWEVHDAKIKTNPPYSRTDIGVAIKMMNDARELFQLPIRVTKGKGSMPNRP